MRGLTPVAVLAGAVFTSVVQARGRAAATGKLELAGHISLMSRGMNEGPAVYGDYVYVGSRTDGLHPNVAGVMIVGSLCQARTRHVRSVKRDSRIAAPCHLEQFTRQT